jgi:hypothetical protein
LYLIRHLPPEFRGRSFVWMFTSGAGFKPELRMRVVFWCDRPVSDEEARRWLKDCPVDLALYNGIQAHYTAAPIIAGMADPVPVRLGLLEDFHDVVPVPELPKPVVLEAEVKPRKWADNDPADRRYALAALNSEAEQVKRVLPGKGQKDGRGRHHALFVGALRMRRFIRSGDLSCAEVTSDLIAAAQRAGLTDPWHELVRTVQNAITTAGAE